MIKAIYKIFCIFFLLNLSLNALEIKDQFVQNTNNEDYMIFGSNLFKGNFKVNNQISNNMNYTIKPGDKINLKIWGIIDLVETLTVDNNSNIFIKDIGVVNLSNIKSTEVQSAIKKQIGKEYKSGYELYATVDGSQPISLFVSGNVNNPGFYENSPSSTILNFIDMAGGINKRYGSFRNIDLMRNNQLIKSFDLYDFLLYGKFDNVQLFNNDVIVVNNIGKIVKFEGDVMRPNRFEIKSENFQELLNKFAIPEKGISSVMITNNFQQIEQSKNKYNISEFYKITLNDGDKIEVKKEHFNKYLTIKINGFHNSSNEFLVEQGATLEDAIAKIELNGKSNIKNLQLFRKSIGARQKVLLEASLKDLELKLLSQSRIASSSSNAIKEETTMLLSFIEKARQVEPKGQMVLDEKAVYSDIVLEDGDEINIPNKHNMVLVQGSVLFPNSFNWREDYTYDDYIKRAGGYADNANIDFVIVIKQNGLVYKIEDNLFSDYKNPGLEIKETDAIMVMPKVSTYTLDVVKDVSSILYNIAISAGVALSI